MDQLNPYAIEVNYQNLLQNDDEFPDSLLDIITQSLPDFSDHDVDQLTEDISLCFPAQHLTTEADPELHSICDATSLSTAACSSSISHKSDIVGVHQMPPLKHQESSHFRISNMLPEPDYFNLLCGPSEESNQCLSTFTDIQPENKQISTVTDETREPIFNIFQHHNYTYHSWKNLTDCGSCNLSLILTSGQSKLPTSKSFSVVSNKDFPDIEVDEYVDVVTVDDDNRSEHLAELINENYSAARCIPITEVWLSKHSLHWNTFKSISVQVEQNSSESYKSIEMSKNYKSDSSASILIDTMNSSALNKNITTHTIPQVATSKETSIKGSSSSWPQPKSLLSTVIEIGGSCYESQPSINYLNTVNRDFGCFPQNSLSKIPDYLIQFSISKPYSQSLANLCSKTSVQTFHQRSVKGNEDDLTLQVETTELYDKIPRYLKDVLKKHSSISTCRKTSGTSLLKREYMKEGPQGEESKRHCAAYMRESSKCRKKSVAYNSVFKSTSWSSGKCNIRDSSSSSKLETNFKSSGSSTTKISRLMSCNWCHNSRKKCHSSSCDRSKMVYLSRPHSQNQADSRNYGRSRFHSQCNYQISRSPLSNRSKTGLQRKRLKKVLEVKKCQTIYVGKIPDNTTRTDLRKRFTKFGHIKEVSVHLRDHGDNYGVVTFYKKYDAYKAVKYGNDDISYPNADLCFRGRHQLS